MILTVPTHDVGIASAHGAFLLKAYRHSETTSPHRLTISIPVYYTIRVQSNCTSKTF